MNPPLTDLSHSIEKLELCLGSLSTEEDCYTAFAAEIERLKRVLKDLRAEEGERIADALDRKWERDTRD